MKTIEIQQHGKFILVLLLAILVMPAWAQKNTVKFNLLPLVSKTFAFEYEREVAPKMSVNVAMGFRGKSNLPFKKYWEDAIEDADFLNKATLGHFTFTPEFRFYLNKNKGTRGFYIGPFIKYGKYNLETEYPLEMEEGDVKDILIKGGISTWSAGFAIGSQFKLSKSVFMDFRILGPHYGSTNGNLKGMTQLTADEQAELRDQLSELEDVDFIKVTTEVTGEGATVKAKGPWAGIRAGLSIGYRF